MPFVMILLIITILATSLIAVIIVLRNPASEITRSFVALISCFIFWAVAQATLYLATSSDLAYFADLITYFAGLCIALTFYRFAYLFPARTFTVDKRSLTVLCIFSSLIMTLIFFPGFMIRDINKWNPGFGFAVNPVPFSLYSIIFFTIFGKAYALLVKKYLAATAENKRLLLHVIYSSLIPVIAGAVLSIIFVIFDEVQFQIYSPSFTLVFTLTVSYLIFIRGNK